MTEVQAVLKQLSEVVREDVGVKFEAPNPSPLIVNVEDEPALFARFELSRLLTLTRGAAPRAMTAESTGPKKACAHPTTTMYVLPCLSAGNGPARSIDHSSPGSCTASVFKVAQHQVFAL